MNRDPRMEPIKSEPKASEEGLDRYLGGTVWMSLADEASALFHHHCPIGD